MRTKLNFLRSRASAAEPATSPADAATAPVAPAAETAKLDAGTPMEAAEAPTPERVRTAARMIEGVRPFERKLRGAVAGTAWRKPAAVAAAIVVTGGLGYAAGHTLNRPSEGARTASARLAEASATMRQSHEEMIRLGGELKAMKVAVEALRGERDRSRGELLGKQAQLADKVERTNGDTVARIGKVAEQLERIERTQRDPARLQNVIERLERIEKHVVTAQASTAPAASAAPIPVASAAPTPPAKPVGLASAVPDVTQTGSLGDVKAPKSEKAEADPRKTQLDGYALRDIDDGYALIEMKNGRFVEVAAGGFLPGIGRVDAIERRGRQWVVLTPKGYIGERGAMDR